jgi:Cu/Ag efflux protein CusF
MKQLTLALALLASVGITQAASHESGMKHDMSEHDMSSHTAPAAMHQGTGVLKAIKSGKVQIAHEPIASLSWPSMTMWFAVKDMPHDLRVGDHVRFDMMQGDKKQWMIVDIKRK